MASECGLHSVGFLALCAPAYSSRASRADLLRLFASFVSVSRPITQLRSVLLIPLCRCLDLALSELYVSSGRSLLSTPRLLSEERCTSPRNQRAFVLPPQPGTSHGVARVSIQALSTRLHHHHRLPSRMCRSGQSRPPAPLLRQDDSLTTGLRGGLRVLLKVQRLDSFPFRLLGRVSPTTFAPIGPEF